MQPLAMLKRALDVLLQIDFIYTFQKAHKNELGVNETLMDEILMDVMWMDDCGRIVFVHHTLKLGFVVDS